MLSESDGAVLEDGKSDCEVTAIFWKMMTLFWKVMVIVWKVMVLFWKMVKMIVK